MNFKRAIITCLVVVLYLSLCNLRFERLNEVENASNDTLVVNVK